MLTDVLREHQEEIRDRWLDALVSTYPTQSASILTSGKDRFRNPVGQALREGATGVLAAFIAQDGAALRAALDRLLRVRAVQEFAPSEAVQSVFDLKPIVREVVGGDPAAAIDSQEWCDFDAQVDRMALIAFDVYMARRERLFDIRANEIRRRTHLLLERTNYFGGPKSE